MNPKQIFNMARKDMILILRSSTAEDIVAKRELFLSYFDLLESMQQINQRVTEFYPDEGLSGIALKSKASHQEQEEASSDDVDVESSSVLEEGRPLEESGKTEPSQAEPSLTEKDHRGQPHTVITSQLAESLATERHKYLFERKLRGGVCPEISAFVPEGIIRKLDLQHGDYVYATETGVTEDGYRKKYLYEVAERTQSPAPADRIQLNLCPVEIDGSTLVITKTIQSGTPQDIRFDEVPFSIPLHDEDIREFNLHEGDLIDIAFPVNKPEAVKVLYIHPTTSQESSDKARKQTTVKKTIKDTNKIEQTLDQTLEGKTILVIGNEPDKASYKKQIEDRGGTFLWADAKDNFVTFQSLVRKCHCVVFLLGVSGHTGMKQIKQLCKEYDIPFQTTFSEGISTVVRLAEEGTSETAVH